MDLARAAGAIVVFNPAPVQALPDSLLARVDYLVVNETEAEQLCGIAVDGAAAAIVAATKLRSRGAGAVLLTMGGRGVVLADAQGVAHYPALRVEAVDTTAAGDTFIGAFAVALLEGGDPAAACMRAQHAAALAVTRPGAQSSIPLRAEVDRFIAERRAGSD
jgi:ribokinase